MQYMLLIYDDERAWAEMPEDERNRLIGEYFRLTEDLQQAGAYVAGDPLQPTTTATTVRVREGDTLVTDGPFAETREQLGGFYVLDCENLDDALAWAKRIPMRGGSIEVRPVMDYEAAGSTAHSREREAQR